MFASWGKFAKKPSLTFVLLSCGIMVATIVGSAITHRRTKWLRKTDAQN
jgi:cytochrome c biogenesis protein ResB